MQVFCKEAKSKTFFYPGVNIRNCYNYFMKNSECSEGVHFHVSCNDVMELDNRALIVEADEPNEALRKVILLLPDYWEGFIEVNDHTTLKASDMPLLDFWRTPSRN
jgi:hypothetical protein